MIDWVRGCWLTSVCGRGKTSVPPSRVLGIVQSREKHLYHYFASENVSTHILGLWSCIVDFPQNLDSENLVRDIEKIVVPRTTDAGAAQRFAVS
jgi:hypothetical protein